MIREDPHPDKKPALPTDRQTKIFGRHFLTPHGKHQTSLIYFFLHDLLVVKSNPTYRFAGVGRPRILVSSHGEETFINLPIVERRAIMSKLGAFMNAVPSGSAAAAPASTNDANITPAPAPAAQPAPEPVTPEDTTVRE